jgi:hypothetical protein
MAEVELPSRALLTQTEAINWLAFGRAVDANLKCWETLRKKWWLTTTHEKSLVGDLRELEGKLRTIARGEPLWLPPPRRPGIPDWLARGEAQVPAGVTEDEAHVRRLMANKGCMPGELADEAKADAAAFQCLCATHYDAETRLGEARARSSIETMEAPPLAPYTEFPPGTVWYDRRDILALRPMPVGDGTMRAKPPQQSVNDEMLRYYKAARDQGASPPKRASAMIDCAIAIHATDDQMRIAIRLVPAELKRRIGARDR